MPVEWEELRLVWPPELFAREGQAVMAIGQNEETAGWLLDEAFHDKQALRMYQEATPPPRAPRASQLAASARGERMPVAKRPQDDLFAALVAAAHTFPRWERKRLYSERRKPRAASKLELGDLKIRFADTLRQLDSTGYFDSAFGDRCPNAGDDPDREGQRKLGEALDTHDVEWWPLGPQEDPTCIEYEWPDELLLDLVEALHDFVARPRQRWFHALHNEHDYKAFNQRAGQAVYRWRINALLDRSDLGLRLSDSGSDAGLLVEVTGDARDDLVGRVLGRGEPAVADRVEHAVALFRHRGATREAKRDATKALADVLEQRKTLVKSGLLTKDSSMLFQIANEFDIRHMNDRQKADYDPLLLDWVFWCYLATIDLTNRLIKQQDTP